MLRCGHCLASWLPSTSVARCTRFLSSRPREALPLDDELPAKQSVFGAAAPPTISMRKRPPKQNLNIIVNDDHIQEWRKMGPRDMFSSYAQLSKSKLTMLITGTAVGGFLLAPVPLNLGALLGCAIGTSMLSCGANAYNQLLEAPYDAQMRRTQSRVLVVHRFSPLHAFSFAGLCVLGGTALLVHTTNPITASLGLLNVFLYAGVYTPMKRSSIACTWAGAVVGALPPVMGYSAAMGAVDPAALCLAAILYSWQFPHFNGLSWNLRGDYSKAGYRVMCVTSESICRRTTIRHAISLVGLCSVAAPLTDLSTFTFAVDSIPVNAYLVYLSYKFYKSPDAKNSRQLFFFSLLYLPLIMILLVVSNMGRNKNERIPIPSTLPGSAPA